MEKHILICGERGVGKSTLIRRLLAESTLPIGGFVTRRLPQADGDGMFPIYLHAAALPPGGAAPMTWSIWWVPATAAAVSGIRKPLTGWGRRCWHRAACW